MYGWFLTGYRLWFRISFSTWLGLNEMVGMRGSLRANHIRASGKVGEKVLSCFECQFEVV